MSGHGDIGHQLHAVVAVLALWRRRGPPWPRLRHKIDKGVFKAHQKVQALEKAGRGEGHDKVVFLSICAMRSR
jgi:hypothetical protein